MRGKTFEFEGEQLTVAQIRERVPALTDASIRNHLQAGRNTRQAMLTVDQSAVRSRNGRVASRKTRSLRWGSK